MFSLWQSCILVNCVVLLPSLDGTEVQPCQFLHLLKISLGAFFLVGQRTEHKVRYLKKITDICQSSYLIQDYLLFYFVDEAYGLFLSCHLKHV